MDIKAERAKQKKLMKKLKDGEIHEIPIKDVSEAKEGDDDEI